MVRGGWRRSEAKGDRVVRIAAELVTLVPAVRDQRLPDLHRGNANVRIAQGEGNPEGNQGQPEPGNGRRDNRRTPDRGEPGEGGQRGRTQRADRETGGSPPGEPEDV